MMGQDDIAQARRLIWEGRRGLTSNADTRDTAFIGSQRFFLARGGAIVAGPEISAFLKRLPSISSAAALIESFKVIFQITRSHEITGAAEASWTPSLWKRPPATGGMA